MKIFEDNVLKICGGIHPPSGVQRKKSIFCGYCGKYIIFERKFGIIGKPVKNLTNSYNIVKNVCEMQLGEICKQICGGFHPPRVG